MADEQPKIIVEVPSDRGHYSPIATPQVDKLEEFKKGWINAIALPNNPTDLIFDITASVTIPALISSCWVSLPIPNFLRIGALIALGISALVMWEMLAIAEVRNYLILRLILVGVGVAVGL